MSNVSYQLVNIQRSAISYEEGISLIGRIKSLTRKRSFQLSVSKHSVVNYQLSAISYEEGRWVRENVSQFYVNF